MADVTSIYGNPIKDAVARQDIATNTQDISDLKDDLTDMNTATSSDVGKALKVKTVTNGKVTEWEFGEAGGGSGLTTDIMDALLQIASKVAYIDANGSTYYQSLYDAFYPVADLDHIGAVYTQSGTVYDTESLDDLKGDLVVTAYFEDETSRILSASEYTLSGTLTEGTSTITVSYGGKTTTFSVIVTEFTTTVIIAEEGKCWSKTAPNTVTKAGFGLSDWYDYEFTQEALEASAYWDSTNEYMTTNGWSGVRCCTPDYLTYAAGYSWPSSANYKHVAGKDDVYRLNFSVSRNALTNELFNRQSAWAVSDNCLSWSIPLLDKEYCYAYWYSNLNNAIYPTGVTYGDIIFAGKYTPYSGLHNISEAPSLTSISAEFTQGQTVVKPSTTLESLKTMLAVTALYDNNKTLPVNLGLVTLTGTLEEGTSTITVTYNNKTATFDVTVSAS